MSDRKENAAVDPSLQSFVAAIMAALPDGLRYDGVMRVGATQLFQFTEMDETSPSFRNSFCVDLETVAREAILKRRIEKRTEFKVGRVGALCDLNQHRGGSGE